MDFQNANTVNDNGASLWCDYAGWMQRQLDAIPKLGRHLGAPKSTEGPAPTLEPVRRNPALWGSAR